MQFTAKEDSVSYTVWYMKTHFCQQLNPEAFHYDSLRDHCN
jgi:hypothetical protein